MHTADNRAKVTLHGWFDSNPLDQFNAEIADVVLAPSWSLGDVGSIPTFGTIYRHEANGKQSRFERDAV